MYELSARQSDVFSAQQIRQDAALNLNGLYSFSDTVDALRLTTAIRDVSIAHAPLTSRIATDNGNLVAIPNGHGVKLESRWHNSDRELYANIYEFARQPFKLRTENPFRCYLLFRDEKLEHMFLQFHHVATDWWSFQVIHQELAERYRTGDAGRARKALSIQECNALEIEATTAQELEEADAHWSEVFRDGLTQPVANGGPMGHVEFEVDADCATIANKARAASTTLFEWTFLQFASVFSTFQSGPFIINTPVGNRNRPAIIRTVGYLMNMVPVRCEVKGDEFCWDQTLLNLRQSIKHGTTPRSKIAAVARKQGAAQAQLFGTTFMFLRDSLSAVELPGNAKFTRIYPGQDEDGLVFTLREHMGSLSGVLESHIEKNRIRNIGVIDEFTARLNRREQS